ncbi:MAG: hypothetical protein Q9204_007079 [Flavoplaca sp. TL-2023a]
MSQESNNQNLVALGNDTLSGFRRAFKAFAQASDGSTALAVFEAPYKGEYQRFQLWLINLGLFQPSHNSLDYRLRQNDTVRSSIASLLGDLCLALDNIVSELLRDDSNKREDIEAWEHPSGDADDSDTSYHLDVKSKLTECAEEDIDEHGLMTMYMEDMIEINDQLMKTAMQIRSPHMRKPRHRFSFPEEAQHNDPQGYATLLRSFRKKGIEQTLLSARRRLLSVDEADNVLELRDSDEYLIDRLAKANDFRRQQFEYWKRYRSHSVHATATATKLVVVDDGGNDNAAPRHLLTQTADVKKVELNQEASKALSMPSVSLLAPDFKLRSVRSAKTHQSRALTIHAPGGDLIAWPEVPLSIPFGKEFEIVFEDLVAYENHVNTEHPTGKEQLLSEGVLATQRVLPERPRRIYPFCDGDLKGLKEIYDHISSHLESIALLAIPTLDDGDEQSDAASSEAAGKDAGGSRTNDFDTTLSVVFPENKH